MKVIAVAGTAHSHVHVIAFTRLLLKWPIRLANNGPPVVSTLPRRLLILVDRLRGFKGFQGIFFEKTRRNGQPHRTDKLWAADSN
jgi:hypothetical protein